MTDTSDLHPSAPLAFETVAAALAAKPLSTEEELRATFDFNKAAVLAALQQAGATAATVDYFGAGDEGRIEGVYTLPESAASTRVCLAVVERSWDADAKRMTAAAALRDYALDDALRELCDAAVTLTGHDGYENGEGGRGALTVDVAAGEFSLEHGNYYVERDVTEHKL
ncbi:hypothetical protein DBR42_17630 [Pelomonas sp. HMWF004]|nr:hypothetical protein DBR42_17630 [Pelomonas sp. HMWF004]